MALASRLFSRGITPHCLLFHDAAVGTGAAWLGLGLGLGLGLAHCLLFHDAAVGTGASDTDVFRVCRLRNSRRLVVPMRPLSVARMGMLQYSHTHDTAYLTSGASADLARESSRRASLASSGTRPGDGSTRRASSIVRRRSS